MTEGAAYGTALLAGVGTGVYRDVENARAQSVHVTDQIKPSQDSRIYAAHYPIYLHLYHALTPYFKQISKP